MAKCNLLCKIYSRVVGYYSETDVWNPGKQAEFEERVPFKVEEEKPKKENVDE